MKTGTGREVAKRKSGGRLFWVRRLVVAALLSLLLLFLREVVLVLTREMYDGVAGDPLHFLSPRILREAFKPGLLPCSLGAVFVFALLRGYVSCAIVAAGEYMGAVSWMSIILHPMMVETDRTGASYTYMYHPDPMSLYGFFVMTSIAIALIVYAIPLIRRKAQEESGEDWDW